MAAGKQVRHICIAATNRLTYLAASAYPVPHAHQVLGPSYVSRHNRYHARSSEATARPQTAWKAAG